MKKVLAISLVLFGMTATKVYADGSQVQAPGPVIAATGQNYFYPSAQSPAAGGLLVQDGIGAFRYSNAVVGTTTTLTVFQFPTLPSVTLAQLGGLTPATTGQLVYCSNCTNSQVCISSGVLQQAWVAVSSGTTTTVQHCQ